MSLSVDDDEYVLCPRCKIYKSDPKTILKHLLQCEEDRELGGKFMRLAAAYLEEHPEFVGTSHDLAAAKKDEKGPITNYEAAKLRRERKMKKAATTCFISQKTDETNVVTGDPEIDGAMAEIKLAETGKVRRRVRDRNFNKEEDKVDGEKVVADAQEGGNVGKQTVVDGKNAKDYSHRGIVINGEQGATLRGRSKIKDDSKGKEKVVDDFSLKKKEQREFRTAVASSKNQVSGQRRFLFGEGSSTRNCAYADGKQRGDVDGGVLRDVRDGKPKADVYGGRNVGKRTAWDSKNVQGGGVENSDEKLQKEVANSKNQVSGQSSTGNCAYADGKRGDVDGGVLRDVRDGKPKADVYGGRNVGGKRTAWDSKNVQGGLGNSDEKLQKEANGANVEKISKEIASRISEYWRHAGEEDSELKIWLSFKINDEMLKIWREAGGDIF